MIIDERTCVLLIDLTEFKGCVDMQPMTDRITAMGIKYQMCWVILLSSAEEEKSGFVILYSFVPEFFKYLFLIFFLKKN